MFVCLPPLFVKYEKAATKTKAFHTAVATATSRLTQGRAFVFWQQIRVCYLFSGCNVWNVKIVLFFFILF